METRLPRQVPRFNLCGTAALHTLIVLFTSYQQKKHVTATMGWFSSLSLSLGSEGNSRPGIGRGKRNRVTFVGRNGRKLSAWRGYDHEEKTNKKKYKRRSFGQAWPRAFTFTVSFRRRERLPCFHEIHEREKRKVSTSWEQRGATPALESRTSALCRGKEDSNNVRGDAKR